MKILLLLLQAIVVWSVVTVLAFVNLLGYTCSLFFYPIRNFLYYRKNSNQVTFLSRNLNGEISKVSMYDNGEKTDNFTETKDKKIVQLNSGTSMVVNVYNYLETDNNYTTINDISQLCRIHPRLLSTT